MTIQTRIRKEAKARGMMAAEVAISQTRVWRRADLNRRLQARDLGTVDGLEKGWVHAAQQAWRTHFGPWRSAATFTVRGVPVTVGRLTKLLRSKKLAGRSKDRQFLRRYQSLLEEEGDGSSG